LPEPRERGIGQTDGSEGYMARTWFPGLPCPEAPPSVVPPQRLLEQV